MAGCRIQRGRAAVLAFALGTGLALAAEPRAQARAAADGPAAPDASAFAAADPALTNLTYSPALADGGDVTRVAARDEVVVRFHEAIERMLGGDYAGSVPILESVIEERPALVNAWTALGGCYIQLGRPQDADALWRQLLAIDPGLPLIHKVLGQLAWMQGDLEQAEAFHRRSLELDPDQYETRLALARLLRRRNRPDEAAAMLRKLLEEDSNRNDVVLELGQALLEADAYEEALPHWQRLAALAPRNERYLSAVADIHLRANRQTSAVEAAQAVLQQNDRHIAALTLMADAHEFGESPADALPYLKRLCEIDDVPDLQQQARVRLIMLLVRLHEAEPRRYTLGEAIEQAEAYGRNDPGNTGMRLLLAELRMINGDFRTAENLFRSVLESDNPNNRRANSGLFELYAAQPDFRAAEKALKALEAFNPLNPYRHYTRAKFAAARGNYRLAYRELDQLEAAGRRGAVAALLYHGLTPSEWSPGISVAQFRQQLAALQEAGFTFLTPSRLPAYFAERAAASGKPSSDPPERAVMITFDDARRDAMRYGTPVALDLGVAFAMHVPVGSIDRGLPYYCSWAQLKDYEATGAWELGSHLLDASRPQRVGPSNTLVYPLCSRLWLEPERRFETDAEYGERIVREYRQSRARLEAVLGHPVAAVAYPMGDIGQETRSDRPEAIAANLREAQAHYAAGFIQSEFCYAVQGDNPMLYKRHELYRGASGGEAVERLLCNHPVYLAWRLRAELAAQEGRIYKSTRELKKMKRGGYPLGAYSNAVRYVHEHLTGAHATPVNIQRITKGPWNLDLKTPYAVARGEYSRDNLESRVWRVHGGGGLDLTPNVTVEGRAGTGRLKQPYSYTNLPSAGGPEITLKERTVGVAPAVKFPNGWTLLGELAARELRGRAPTNFAGGYAPCDRTFWRGVVEGQIKPWLPLDLTARWERDVVPVASAAAKGVTYNAGSLNASLALTDWWFLYGSGARYWFSDDNTRDHLALGTRFLVYEPPGLHLGALYTYDSADEEKPDYWTPYELSSFYLEALLRRTYRRTYYNVGLRYGIGRENMRPEALPRHEAAVSQMKRDLDTARRNQWSRESIANLERWLDDLMDNPPEDPDWHRVLSAVASFRTRLGKHWQLNGEVSYNRKPDYKYLAFLGGVKYTF